MTVWTTALDRPDVVSDPALVSAIYLRGHWHHDRLLRYDPVARESEVLSARDLPRDRRYWVGRFQLLEEGHLVAVVATESGPNLVINDATEVPLRDADLSIEAGSLRDTFVVVVKGVEIVRIEYIPECADEWFEREDFELLFWLVKHYCDESFVTEHTRTTPSPTWWLWLRDRFEYPPPPRVVVATGPDLLSGYHELWKAHLGEGIDERGREHFNEFILDTADEAGERAVTLRGRREREEMIALHRWAKESHSVASAMGAAHLALRHRGDDPVSELLAIVKDASGAEDLASRLRGVVRSSQT